jgi:hypothetical protein
MRPIRSFRLFVALAVLGPAALRADGLGAIDCTVEPFDGSSENAYGVVAPFTAEWCSAIAAPPADCRAGSYYYANLEAELSRPASGSSTMTFTAQFRAGNGTGAAGAVVLGPIPGYASGVPIYPASTRAVATGSNLTILSEVAPTLACIQFVGTGPSATQYLTVDRSAATPPVPCLAGNPPDIDELCTSFDPTMRALRIARSAGRYGGPCDGAQVVPPDPTALRCGFRAWQQPGNLHGIEIRHDLVTVTDVGINLGSPGVNGPRVFTITPPYSSPILRDGLNFAALNEALIAGRLYLEIISPTADVRAQILPANLIVQCDHETGAIGDCYDSHTP